MTDNDWESTTRIGSKVRGPGSGGVDRERVVKGKSAINAASRSGAIIGTEKKYAGANTKPQPEGQHLTKVDRDPDIVKPKEVGSVVGQAIQAGRGKMEPKLTQQDLANRTSIRVNIIQQYEQGKAPPDQAQLAKMERVLGIKLRGANNEIGKPLGGPKKKT